MEEKRRWIWKMLKGKLKSTDHIGWVNGAKEQENHQDKEFIRFNARKLKGTGIGVSEQYPEEIEKTRKSLYPESLRKLKRLVKRQKS